MSEPAPVVDRCVCFDVTFARMLAEGCESLEDVVARWGCTKKCGLCKPYILRTLETREIRHSIALSSEPITPNGSLPT